jgi:hypothetical protein
LLGNTSTELRMRCLVLPLLFVVAGCGGSTAPGNGGNTSLLMTNKLLDNFVYITWKNGEGVSGKDSVVPGMTNQCVRFTAPDSASWIINAAETNGGTASVGGNWYHPPDRAAWTVIVLPGPMIYAWDSAAAASGLVYGQTRPIPQLC